MSTDLQIQANRSNSQKSTGPRTAAGKLTSSQNACKTGIYSQAEIIRDESREDLDALASDYHTHYQPAGPAESALVDILIHSEWMLRRFRRAEAQLWDLNIEDNSSNSSIDDYSLGIAVNVSDSITYVRLQRRIDSTQRNFQRALKDLNQLQANRPIAGLEPASETAPVGFVPSTAPMPAPTPAAASADPSVYRGNPSPSVDRFTGSAPPALAVVKQVAPTSAVPPRLSGATPPSFPAPSPSTQSAPIRS